MRINIIGLVGAVIAIVGLVLPWWTMTFSMTIGVNVSYSASIYLYQTTASGIGISVTRQMDLWYGWAAFTLLVLGALLGIAFSLTPRARIALVLGGILVLLSVIVFAAGLQNDLSSKSGLASYGLFSNGSFSTDSLVFSYATYLSFGFWLALVGAIVMLVAPLKKPEETAPQPIPPPPPQEKAGTPTS